MMPHESEHAARADDRLFAEGKARILALLGHRFPRYPREVREDVVQETFLRFIRFDRLHAIRNPIALMLVIAHRVACDVPRENDTLPPDEHMEDLRYRHEDDVVSAILLQVFHWVREHREEDLALFALRVRGVGHAEIARRLGLSHEAVRKRVSRLYEAIRRHFDGTEIDDLLDDLDRP